jgi:hypothetical protein
MLPRLVLLVALLPLVACRSSHEGAVKLTVSYTGFKPGCLRVAVKDAAGGGETRTTELAGKGEATGGAVTVAAFRETGWSATLAVSAEAFEKECKGTPVSTASGTVTVDKNAVAETELALAATDADGDGYVSQALGGTDCYDNRPEAYPDAPELCNALDDNCDAVKDEGFELGALCDATNGCKGAWVCGTQGARVCEARPGLWRQDNDKDGRGSRQGTGVTSCTQPDGYVPNDLDCDDNNPRRYTGAPELCNALDDDCDDAEDDGLDVGGTCTGDNGCGGNRACASDGGVVCNSPPRTVLYPDNDLDQRGKADAGISSCEPTLPGHVTDAGDCDDTRANVYAGAPEICDEQDNDCDGTRDEGYTLDAGCDPGLGCSGVRTCAADGGTQCAYVTPPSNYYPDEDQDLHGKADAGVLTCTPDAGYIPTGGDCNEGNPFMHADAPELCDLEDNDCDGTKDEDNACPADGGTWVSQTTGSDNWRSVSIWGDGGVWVVGGTNGLRLRQPGQTTFQDLNGQCTGQWNAVWADPRDGKAYLGGNATITATRTPDATSCSAGMAATDTDVRGIFGLTLSDGGTELHVVGQSRIDPIDGRLLWWNGAQGYSDPPPDVAPIWDVHGSSRNMLLAVGGYEPDESSNAGARIYRFSPSENDWKTESVQNITGVVDDRLRGVWVVSPTLAYAVGESSSFLVWNGTAWTPRTGPTSEDLLSVIAFGRNSVYVTTGSGRVYRFDGNSWFLMPGLSPGSGALNDIAGTSPGDLWVVGDNGKLLHWPR